MATKDLSAYDQNHIPNAREMKFGIVVSEWNSEITFSLLDATKTTLTKHGAKEENITVSYVPGTFELTFGAKQMAEGNEPDAVIVLGCVIRGGTPHFEYVCQGVTYGLAELNLSFDIPFIFGVLTTDDETQAKDRAGGVHGNKGDEAAITAIKMVSLIS